MGLYTTGCTEHAHTAVQHFQGAVHLNGEVHVTGGVNNIELMLFPETGGCSRLNRNPTLLLLLHEVRGSGTLMDLTDFVDFSGELQDPFGSGGFTRVDVGKDTDVAVACDVFTHNCSLLLVLQSVGGQRFGSAKDCRLWLELLWSQRWNHGDFLITRRVSIPDDSTNF